MRKRNIIRDIALDEHIELIDGNYYHVIFDEDNDSPYAEFALFLGPGGRPPRTRRSRVHTPRVATKRRKRS